MPVPENRTNSLIIFGRFPRLGQVKTRLAPYLTEEGCLELQQALLADTVNRISAVPARPYLYLADCSRQEIEAFRKRQKLDAGLLILPQTGKDLGDRMWQAYREIGGEDSAVVFIGTDAPSVPLEYLRESFRLLRRFPVVLGPVADGGYYLLGLSEARKELFFGIEWGTSSVLKRTMERLSEGEFALLPEWYDIDVREDLVRLAKDLQTPFEGFPDRTRKFLNSRSGLEI